MEFGGGPFIAAGPDNNVYAVRNWKEGKLYKIKSDGTKELLYKTDGYIGLLPSVGADKMILVSVEKSVALYSISPSGSLKLKYYLNGIYGTFAFDNNGTAYIGYGKIYGTLSAINSDGTKKWEFITRD